MTNYRSPLLDLPGAVAGNGIDAPVAALVLSPQGHVEHAMYGLDDGEAFTAHVEPGQAEPLRGWLDSMRFMMRVEVADVTDEVAVTWRPSARRDGAPYSGYELVRRGELATYAAAAGPACGLWAFEALRIARGEPRLGLDTDERTIPNEAGWISTAVHLDKGCYRGQETVARVHNLGRPPRRLVVLNLDGSQDVLPAAGAPVLAGGRTVGRVGTAAQHHEDGPVALALVKRSVGPDTPLLAGPVDARLDPADAIEEDAIPRSAVDHAAFRQLGVLRRN